MDDDPRVSIENTRHNYDTLNRFAIEALRSVLLVTAGATLASMTIIGTLLGLEGSNDLLALMARSTLIFAFATSMAVASSILNYFIVSSQLFVSLRLAKTFRLLAVLSVIVAWVLLIVGIVITAVAFLKLN